MRLEDGLHKNERHQERRTTIVPSVVHDTLERAASKIRRMSIYDVYEKAKATGQTFQRQKWAQVLFEYAIYTLLIAFVYLVLTVGCQVYVGSGIADHSRAIRFGTAPFTGYGGW
jgi:hypothetical protein